MFHGESERVQWQFSDLPCADAHSLEIQFSCSVRIANNPADRKMFAEVFPTATDQTTNELIRAHFKGALKSTFTKLSSQCKAADVIGGEPQWLEEIKKALNPLAFSAGLELLPPFQLEIESSTLVRQRLKESARTRTAEQSAAQLEQMHRAADLLKQFQTMRQASPELSAGKIIQRFSATDHAAVLQSLMHASSDTSKKLMLWAVAGSSLIHFDAHAKAPHLNQIELPNTLGPLRSVQLCEEKLLIGAQTGVMHASANDPSKVTTFAYPNLQSQLGFNSVACHANMIWASHGEAGIVGWKLDHPDVPATIYPESTARNLQILQDEKILYSIGEQLILRNRESRTALPSQSLSQIIAIIPAAHIIIVHQDGMLVLLDRITHEIVDTRRRPSQICAAAAMPWLGEIRLLLASVDGSIDCVGIDDPLISEYLSPYRGLKKLAAAGDLIAAISPDRQRIVLWHNWDAQRPIGEIHITSKTRHRVADIAFA